MATKSKSIYMSFTITSLEDMREAVREWDALRESNSDLTGTVIFEAVDKDEYALSLNEETS